MSNDFQGKIQRIKATNPIEAVARRLGLSAHGHGGRLWCPSCQAAGPAQHKTPDLALYSDTNSYKCWKCGNGGDAIALVQLTLSCSFKEALDWFDAGGEVGMSKRFDGLSSDDGYIIIPPSTPPLKPAKQGASSIFHEGVRPLVPPNFERPLGPVLQAYQRALLGSPGERYFASRGFTLEQCQRFGLGYSAPGKWLRPKRDWKHGRVVFPSYDLEGRILNLYGRAVEWPDDPCPDYLRHDFLPGPKGYFPLGFYQYTTVCVTEGPFDCFALLASGLANAVCIYGLKSFRWSWLDQARHIIFAFDADKYGRAEFEKLAFEGTLRGKVISKLHLAVYRGCKDLAEAFQKSGSLRI